MHKPRLAWLAAALFATAFAGSAAQAEPATLYHGGTIITMDGDSPQTVEAVVARDGRIAFAGPEAEARTVAGADAADRDLHGATMLPGFIDAHSHFTAALQGASTLDLTDPSLPPVKDIAGLLAALHTYAE
ncbi:MAG: amidohydrolase family protein, partial [Novosphingobium sp.]|nr:amidohydrolase family protein [Novosphingobium sp.]